MVGEIIFRKDKFIYDLSIGLKHQNENIYRYCTIYSGFFS